MISFFYVVSYCHLLATLQTISIIVVNLKTIRAVFRIVIGLLRFSFDSPSYIIMHGSKNVKYCQFFSFLFHLYVSDSRQGNRKV